MTSENTHLWVILKQVVGFIYPNEIELHWNLLIVIYPYITGVVAGAFILASLVKVFKVHEVQPTYRLSLLTALSFLNRRPRATYYPSREACKGIRDVPHAEFKFGHGHVWFCVRVVPDSGPAS